jgi:hypothetical protein
VTWISEVLLSVFWITFSKISISRSKKSESELLVGLAGIPVTFRWPF